ncbi:hypothetical protein MSTE_01810 [Mycobacteroides stephanolepidis]|uniref:Uncharacterized protein n=1 Tax=[Mycobacterium] stephanolepidis TaxID=1520670 RepID=A0A1Z4EW11_9MYCO|nr:hypothetical protein [[Mycobacterium] stephanolepidis]BAX97127.1 hypothetical protein MSTE_01810 [[Mycobacterium] stephanolepidis]
MSIPDRPEAEERQRAAHALDLRTSGMTYAAVAVELGYSDESGPRKAVDRLLSRIEHEGASELRQLEGQRLDAMQRAIWTQACEGDIDSIKAVLSVMARRAKLFGIDAPQRVQVGADPVSDRQYAERLTELVGGLNPRSLRDILAQSPGGGPVLAAARRTASGAEDSPPEADSPLCGPLSGETGTLDEGWSNVGGADGALTPLPDEPDDADDFSDVPPAVAVAAEKAAMAVVADWRGAHR